MFCPECGEEISDNSKYCKECGAEMKNYEISKSDINVSANELLDNKKEEVKCPKCGTQNPLDSKFCEECGNTLNSIDNKKEEVKCPKCGTQNPLDSKFCEECGNTLNSIDKPIIPNSNTSQLNGKAENHEKNHALQSTPEEQKKKNTTGVAILAICLIGLIIFGAIIAIGQDANTSTDTTDYSSSSDYSSSYDDSSYSSSSDSSNSYSSASAEIPIDVVVHYDGKWQGAIGGLSSSSSYSGYGDRVISFTGTQNSYISATVQKNGGGSGTLTVEIYKDGKLVNSQSTNAAYGIVTLSG